MAGRVRKHILQLVGLGHQQADILVVPLGRRHVLDEEQDALEAVLRIHDILGWIRIRIWISGSMPLTNGSGCGSGSCYFRQ